MADAKEKIVDEAVERGNSLTYDEKVIKKIVGYATGEIPGIIAMSGNFISGITEMLRNTDDPTKGINVEIGKKQVAIDMKVVCEYGRNIPQVFQSVVDKVSATVKEMTGLEVVEVNIHVYDVLMKDDFERQNKKRTEEKVEARVEVKTEDTEPPMLPHRVE